MSIRSRTSFFLVLVLAAALWSASSCPAAVTDEQVRQWKRCDGWEVSAFALEGAPPDMARPLAAGLRLHGQRKLLQGLVRPPFKAASLVEDIRRVRLYLAQRGFPASAVTVRLDLDEGARRVGITLAVDPGPEVLLGRVDIEGWPEDLPVPGPGTLPEIGNRFGDLALEEGRELLLGTLHDAGFAKARVEARVGPESPGSVLVVYAVEPGEPFIIDEVRVEGCAPDLVPLAHRIIDIPGGTKFSATRLADASVDLRTTQLFSQVELSTEPTGPGTLLLDARLADARMREWSASIGTWSDNPWVVQAGWTHRNLLQRGRGVHVGGRYATHDQRIGAEVFKLGLLSPRALTRLRGEWIREDEDAYLSKEYGFGLSQSFRPRNRGLWQFGTTVSRVDVVTYSPDASDLPESQEWVFEVWLDRKWDWTDDLLYPTRGGSVRVSATWAPEVLVFGASYVQADVEAVGLRGLGPLGILAARVRGGWSRPLGESADLLANRRFYAGGFNTMRGYARRKLGPRDADGNPRGGQALALAAVELRRRLFWIIDAAVFLDAGQVWRTPDEMDLGDIQTAWGADLDLRTPLGPVRIGHAWVLTEPLEGEPDKLWHFGIGYPW
jgi:translocation and assembly module TamA